MNSAHEHKTRTHRFLLCPDSLAFRLLLRPPQMESLDCDTHAFDDPSSVRKVTIPFELPVVDVTMMDSSNGIVFLAFSNKKFYAWNPSSGFFKRLHDLGSPLFEDGFSYIGVGYFPATNDYRVFIYSVDRVHREVNPAASVFSTKANAWKMVQVSFVNFVEPEFNEVIFFNEALHWIDYVGNVVAFDLAEEEEQKNNIRIMAPPYNYNHHSGTYNYLGVPTGGFLSLAHHSMDAPDYIEVWVMKTYGVSDSWTEIFTLNVSYATLAEEGMVFHRFWVLEDSTVVEEHAANWAGLIRIDHKEEGSIIDFLGYFRQSIADSKGCKSKLYEGNSMK